MDDKLQTLMIALVVLAAWASVVFYSKRHYQFLACKGCGGTGKHFEPYWMAWCCLRKTRAFSPCGACSGSAKKQRRGWR